MSRAIWSGVFTWCLLASCGSVSPQEAVCGDGELDPGEQCDDGNVTSADGCSATCAIEMSCGNALLEGTEQCDDGDTTDGDGCSATCMLEMTCGNGVEEGTEECDDGGVESSDGCSSTCTIEAKYEYGVSWSFRTIANAIQPCPASYDTIAVYSQLLGADDVNVGPVVIDLFSCSAGSGTVAPLTEGRYRVWLESTNATDTMKYASSTSAILDLTGTGLSFTANIYTDGGYFKWTWDLVGEVTNNPLTCAAAGTDSVDMISTVTSSTSAYDDVFDCLDGAGLTAALPAGGYTVSISALNGADESLGTAPALTNQIQAPNKVTDLGTVSIPISGL